MYFAQVFDFCDDMLMFSKWHICFVLTLKRQFVTENTADYDKSCVLFNGTVQLGSSRQNLTTVTAGFDLTHEKDDNIKLKS